jgi:hypothetical protein
MIPLPLVTFYRQSFFSHDFKNKTQINISIKSL